jgi:hypothetical protein
LDEKGVGVVKQTVEDGCSEDVVAEDGTPQADELIRGDEHAAALVATGDELEEQVVPWKMRTESSRTSTSTRSRTKRCGTL